MKKKLQREIFCMLQGVEGCLSIPMSPQPSTSRQSMSLPSPTSQLTNELCVSSSSEESDGSVEHPPKKIRLEATQISQVEAGGDPNNETKTTATTSTTTTTTTTAATKMTIIATTPTTTKMMLITICKGSQYGKLW